MLDNQLSNFLINFLWTKVVLLKKALYNQMSVIVGLQKNSDYTIVQVDLGNMKKQICVLF